MANDVHRYTFSSIIIVVLRIKDWHKASQAADGLVHIVYRLNSSEHRKYWEAGSSLRSVMQVSIHFTIFQSHELSGWFVPKIMKICLNLSKLRPKNCLSLFFRTQCINFNFLF